MRKGNVGVLAALVLGAILLFANSAHSEALRWTLPTTFTDNTPISAAQAATMTVYVRVDQPNPRDLVGKTGWYYLGETKSGGLFFPADNSLSSLMRSYGFSGKTVRFTASAAYKDTDGIERDGPQSPPLSWVVPSEPVLPKTPKSPTFSIVR